MALHTLDSTLESPHWELYSNTLYYIPVYNIAPNVLVLTLTLVYIHFI